jgi:hypothetical protein
MTDTACVVAASWRHEPSSRGTLRATERSFIHRCRLTRLKPGVAADIENAIVSAARRASRL